MYLLKLSVFVLLLIGNTNVFSQAINSPLWCDLEPGKYDIGFKVDYLVDSTRLMSSSDSLPHAIKGRPIRVKLYYPGIKGSSSLKLNFIDQINIFPSNHQFHTYNGILNARDRNLQGQFSPRSDSLRQVLFNMPTMAYANITYAEGEFPLLIYSLGLDDHQMENSVLWEYLASHGFVVAVVPCFGESLDRIDVPYTADGINLLVNDAIFVLNTYKNTSHVDPSKIVAFGHSFGGLTSLLLAARNDEISGVVSLEGSHNNERGLSLLKDLNINFDTMTAPLLNTFVDAPSRILTFSESLKSKVYQVAFSKSQHYDFQNFGLYGHVTSTSDARVERIRSSEEGKDVLISNILLTKHFLDFVCLDSKTGLKYIQGKGGENVITSQAKFWSPN